MNSKKVYTADHAFAARLGFNFSENKGRILENIVYTELLRRDCEVYYYSGNNECDFLIKKGLTIVNAIQVVDQLDRTNYKRRIPGSAEAMQTLYDQTGNASVTNIIEKSDILSTKRSESSLFGKGFWRSKSEE
jgi:predicted AAA+ superfamily ATPase